FAETPKPLLARGGGEGGLELGEQVIAVPVAPGEVGVAVIVGELGATDLDAERSPELLLRAGDDDPAVRGGEVLERHDRRVRGVRAAWRLVASRGSPRADITELGERCLEEGDVAVAADALPSRTPEAGDDRDRGHA